MINAQLQEMLTKLETKLKREVQQRIESQRKLHRHLHDTGAALENSLLTKFDEECQDLQERVGSLEGLLSEWEPSLLRDLTDNR